MKRRRKLEVTIETDRYLVVRSTESARLPGSARHGCHTPRAMGGELLRP